MFSFCFSSLLHSLHLFPFLSFFLPRFFSFSSIFFFLYSSSLILIYSFLYFSLFFVCFFYFSSIFHSLRLFLSFLSSSSSIFSPFLFPFTLSLNRLLSLPLVSPLNSLPFLPKPTLSPPFPFSSLLSFPCLPPPSPFSLLLPVSNIHQVFIPLSLTFIMSSLTI